VVDRVRLLASCGGLGVWRVGMPRSRTHSTVGRTRAETLSERGVSVFFFDDPAIGDGGAPTRCFSRKRGLGTS
jgi:hypothetical protein